ncbi:MAG TPA: HEAT repeat domain-containing protein, partial [Gemmataceae bacterium]|nr:HEAT repeat domain-containing protein [Gemmataceae bacterium]
MRSSTPLGFILGLLLLAPAVGRAAPEEKAPVYNGKTLAAWIAQLKDEDAGARRDAAGALGWFGPKAADAVGPLIAALADPDDTVRDG